MFDARDICPSGLEEDSSFHDATAAGRGYAAAGGVADAIGACLKEYYPEVEVHIEGTLKGWRTARKFSRWQRPVKSKAV